MTQSTSITDIACYCFVCDWAGTVGLCSPDIDRDGNLGCPICGSVVDYGVEAIDITEAHE